MAECEPVKVAPYPVDGDVPAVDAILLLTVNRVVLHLRVDPHNHRPYGVVILKHRKINVHAL